MKRRIFPAEEKAAIVLEVLRGEKSINEIASENEIAPNQIRNWKSEAIAKMSMIFDIKRDNKLKETIESQQKELDTAYKKIGQLTTQVDWLEKKSGKTTNP